LDGVVTLFSITIGFAFFCSASYFSCNGSFFTVFFGTHLGVTLGFTPVGTILGTHSTGFTVPLVRGLTFLKLLIAVLNFSIGIPTVFAISHIRRGLASASQPQNAGFASCPNTIHPPVITHASHFAASGFKLAPAICHWIFFHVYCSMSFTIS
tara:strand:+ start:7360 stop:7818 length:459 start_codon:yes stop_codon:yes gene_type:complete